MRLIRGFFLITTGLLTAAGVAFSQSNLSPYSIYGIGTPQGNPLPNGFAMGGVYNGLRDSLNINFLNPASYSAIDVTQLQAGFETNIFNRQVNNFPLNNVSTFINQVVIGVPVMKRKNFGWGMALGFMPQTQVGYKIFDTTDLYLPDDTIRMRKQYDGTGGYNRIFLGTGFRIGKGFSFGVNAEFMFGTTQKNRAILFPNGNGLLSSRVQELTRINSINVDAGLQYTVDFIQRVRPYDRSTGKVIDSIPRKLWKTKRILSLTFGATYKLGRSITANYEKLGIQFFNASTEFGVDTFLLEPGSTGRIVLPHYFGFGTQLSNGETWKLLIDFNYASWSQFRYLNEPNSSFFDSYGIATGVEWNPNFKDKYGKRQFVKNIIYRGGLRYQNYYLRPDGREVDEIGISFGFALPVNFRRVVTPDLDAKNVFSYVNLGFEFGFDKSRGSNAINDRFFRLNVTFTLRDKWFIKRKFN